MTGSVVAASAAIAIAMLPMASPASADGTWTLTLGTPTGLTTTGFIANGTVTPDGNGGFVQVLYEPIGTPITTSSPTASGFDDLQTNPGTSPLPFSLTVDQLAPNTEYHYEMLATEDDNDAMFTSSPVDITTPAAPTGPGTPIDPPNDPPANGIFGFCGDAADQACVNDINGTRADQEQLPPIALPTNWSTLTPGEQMFVWADLERTSRGEAAIPNLVNTYDAAVQTGLTNDADPDVGASIWAGAFPNVPSAFYGWMYDDGPGGGNEDCTTPTAPGCWGHRDNILSNASNFGNPNEMDAAKGTDSGGNVDYAATFVDNPNPTPPANIVFTWAQEQPFLGTITPTAPSVASLTPSSGPTTGGTSITLTGSGFTGATSVTFGGLLGKNVVVVNDTTITVTTPPNTTGAHNVQVTTPIGQSPKVPADLFTYTGPPAVTAVSPNSGPLAGGTNVTITGTGFTGATAVTVGGLPAKNVVVVSDSTVTATLPADTAGLHNVQVTTPLGSSAKVAADGFTYLVPPAITGVSPNLGPLAGGTNVTITGTGFTGATAVTVGGLPAKNVVVVSDTSLTATVPANTVGLHNIQVTAPSGTSAKVAADGFTYVAAPTVTGISPSSGPDAGGTTVTLTGTGFTGATAVLFGGIPGKNITVVSNTTITVTSPANTTGLHNVQVTTPGGTSAKVAADGFTYS
jgi:hypothetical protein